MKLNKISESLNQNEKFLTIGKKLSESVKGGVAFHHAGLSNNQRKTVEELFKSGDLFCIVATPTLAQGVNLPARRVVIRDVRRWSTAASRNMPMPIMEIKQMLGRAGRPKYDKKGDAWIVCKSQEEEIKNVEHFLLSEPEKITSKLANPSAQNAEEDPALLTHILSLIATSDMNDRDAIGKFFSNTFLSTHLDSEHLENQIDRVIKWLFDNEMIVKDGESEQVKEKFCQKIAVKRPKMIGMMISLHGQNLHQKFLELTLLKIVRIRYQVLLQERVLQYSDLRKPVIMKLKKWKCQILQQWFTLLHR